MVISNGYFPIALNGYFPCHTSYSTFPNWIFQFPFYFRLFQFPVDIIHVYSCIYIHWNIFTMNKRLVHAQIWMPIFFSCVAFSTHRTTLRIQAFYLSLHKQWDFAIDTLPKEFVNYLNWRFPIKNAKYLNLLYPLDFR